MSRNWEQSSWSDGNDDYLCWNHRKHGIVIQLGDTNVTDDKPTNAEGLADTLSELDIEKKKLEIRKLTAEARRHELEMLRSERDWDAWNASADEHRIYNFFGVADASNCIAAMDVLGNWFRRGTQQDVTIVFNSPGGSVVHGLGLYDFLVDAKTQGHKITTVARGMAASMGGVLLQAGDERVVGYNSQVLIHEITSLGIGKMSELEDEIKFLKGMQNKLLDILAERSTMTKKQIDSRWKRKDWWLSADEAVQLGFADRVG